MTSYIGELHGKIIETGDPEHQKAESDENFF
jgi:hypothetical protein